MPIQGFLRPSYHARAFYHAAALTVYLLTPQALWSLTTYRTLAADLS